MTLVLGLDLSLTSPGLALIEDGQIVAVSNIKTTGKRMASRKHPDGAKIADRAERLAKVVTWFYDEIEDCYDEITLGVIEGPAMGSTNGSMHDRSGLWWAIISWLHEVGVTLVEVAPGARAKYITGSGRADKATVLAHAIERYQPNLDANSAGLIGKCDDIADAIGLADMGSRRLGFPVVADMPSANLEAMDGVLWPVL